MKKEISEAINAMRKVSARINGMTPGDSSDATLLEAASNELAALNAELAQNDELIAHNDELLLKLGRLADQSERSANLLERWFLISTSPSVSETNDHALVSVPLELIADTESFVIDDEDEDIDAPEGLGGTPISDVRPEDFGEPAGPDYTGS